MFRLCELAKIYDEKLLINHSVYLYNRAFHDLMVNYKRYGDYILYAALQELCVKELSEFKADVYVPVPTSPEHIAKRQFDTITALYGSLVPLTNMLGKKAGLGAQGEKNRAERLTSEQSFLLRKTLRLIFKNALSSCWMTYTLLAERFIMLEMRWQKFSLMRKSVVLPYVDKTKLFSAFMFCYNFAII
ncbi:hypothetical protein SDC49_21015 [Lactobacillus sp. R2/2]|nr:hypothetical protein [Lactobacillus sp. R2/2]